MLFLPVTRKGIAQGKMMNKYHIKLNERESELIETLGLLPSDSDLDCYKRWRSENKGVVCQLLESLDERNAILEVRWKYWDDPEYQTDRRLKSSRKKVFESNGNFGQDIYEHVHFLPYLRYFLFGAYLPDQVIARFEERVEKVARGHITSGDYEPISKYAKSLIREYSLQDDPREEFFKLCLDMELSLFSANIVRRFIGNVKIRN